MTAEILRCDAAFRRWLAGYPGLWREVGVFDEAASLVMLMAERRSLGLPSLATLRGARPGRVRRRSGNPVPADRREGAEVRI